MGSAPLHILYLVPCRHYNPSIDSYISTSSSQHGNVQYDSTRTWTAKTTSCQIEQEHIFFKTNERKRVCIFHHYLFISRFLRVGHTTESKGVHLKLHLSMMAKFLVCIHKRSFYYVHVASHDPSFNHTKVTFFCPRGFEYMLSMLYHHQISRCRFHTPLEHGL